MPTIKSTYNPSYLLKNTHFNTIFRTFFAQETVNYTRERINLSDGDFLDLDFIRNDSDTILIALHGLEGSSNSPYIKAISKHFSHNKMDVCAVNFRGCSGEDNRLLYAYHSGKTEDLHEVVQYINSNNDYKNIIIVGYSLGGNVTLKYIGEHKFNIPNNIIAAIGISVPCDLTTSSSVLAEKRNSAYMYQFLRTLKAKTLVKLEKFPHSFIDKEKVLNAKNFRDFDDAYTAPAHGFKDAEDYWAKNSSKQFLNSISMPTLIVNAADDTFLSKECFPTEIAQKNSNVSLEIPKHGGHVGFNSKLIGKNGFWLEKRIYEFVKSHIKN